MWNYDNNSGKLAGLLVSKRSNYYFFYKLNLFSQKAFVLALIIEKV